MNATIHPYAVRFVTVVLCGALLAARAGAASVWLRAALAAAAFLVVGLAWRLPRRPLHLSFRVHPRVPLLLLLALAPVAVRADDALPRPYDAGRYAKMADRSPFAPPTPVQAAAAKPPPPPPGPKWSDQLAVTLLTQQGSTYFVSVVDKSKSERFLLRSDQEDADRQLAVTSVAWGEKIDQTVVTLRHRGEFASVHFDAGLSSTTTGGGGAMNPGAPVMSGPAVPGRPAPNIPGMPAYGQPGLNPNITQRQFTPPGNPGAAGVNNVQRRQAVIRQAPVVAPAIRPPATLNRPINKLDDDDDDDE